MDRVGSLAERYIRSFLRPEDGVVYVGVFLSPMSSKKLLRAFPPVFDQVWAHHMTVWHYRREGERPDALPWGRTVQLKVTQHIVGNQAQAVVVAPPTRLRPAGGQVPHVSVSTAQGVSPAASNHLLQGEQVSVSGLPALKGQVGWVDEQGKIRFTEPDW